MVLVARAAIGTGGESSIANLAEVDNTVTALGAGAFAVRDVSRGAASAVGGTEAIGVIANFACIEDAVTTAEATTETSGVSKNRARFAVASAGSVDLPVAGFTTVEFAVTTEGTYARSLVYEHVGIDTASAVSLARRIEGVFAYFGRLVVSYIESFPITDAVTANGTTVGTNGDGTKRASTIGRARGISSVALFWVVDFSITTENLSAQERLVQSVNLRIGSSNRIHIHIPQVYGAQESHVILKPIGCRFGGDTSQNNERT